MIREINSQTAFKGIIWVPAGDNYRISGNKAHIFNIEKRGFSTDEITNIEQFDNYGYTSIYTKLAPKAESYNVKAGQAYYIPSSSASTTDILAAYAASKDSNLQVQLRK